MIYIPRSEVFSFEIDRAIFCGCGCEINILPQKKKTVVIQACNMQLEKENPLKIEIHYRNSIFILVALISADVFFDIPLSDKQEHL